MKEIIYKLLWLQLYKKWDRFIFEWVWRFKIIWYYRHLKSYDCEFYEFDKFNKERKTYQIISEIDMETNILIHKIDNKKILFWNSVNIEWDWNIVIQK